MNDEMPWEKDKREYDALSPEEKTWHKLTEPVRRVYAIDVGRMSLDEAQIYLNRIREEIRNG